MPWTFATGCQGRVSLASSSLDGAVMMDGLRRHSLSWTIAAVCLGATWAWGQSAQACGGLFCDGAAPMPVDQSGEDILFVPGDGTIEVHIRIQYEGNPADFAWVLPVQSVPTDVAVGSDPLFVNIKNGSVPTYGLNRTFESCGFNSDESAAGGGESGGGEEDDGGGDSAGGPVVALSETVGAFELTVLTGGTAQETIAWLEENGYQQDPEAEPILAEYLAEGFLLAAIKLKGGAELDEIHPIALTFASNEPCVPLRLTRIAATENMDVRTYFLGDGRVVPQNYRHVLVNPLKIDWANFGSNYKEVIGEAVDAQHADGRAFVTEYAGPSSVVSSVGLYYPDWDADAFRGTDVAEALLMLESQALVNCRFSYGYYGYYGYEDYEYDEYSCRPLHPLLTALLAEFLPPPDGIAPGPYLGTRDADLEALMGVAWDSEGFADLLDERVIQPGLHAADLLEANPYLSRLYTTISPWEMTADPIFLQNPELGEIPAQRTADQFIRCDGSSRFTLPDGRVVLVGPDGVWPEIGDDDQFAEIVEEYPAPGAPVTLADNTKAIEDALDDHNGEMQTGCGCTASPGSSKLLAPLLLLLAALRPRRRRS